MKLKAPLLALIILLSTVFPRPSCPGEEKRQFVLPKSLTVIEESAFEETAPEMVVLQNAVAFIGEKALANAHSLVEIIIPESVRFIDDTAFEGVSGLAIQGEKDSYAALWAQEHNVAFVQMTRSPAGNKVNKELSNGELLLMVPFLLSCPNGELWRRRRNTHRIRSMRPQDRPELYPINYRFP